jgi:hypothetical protein
VAKIGKDDALRVLEAGESAGAKRSTAKPQPFYNPHLLLTSPERTELEKSFYGRLLDSAECYLFNSGVAGADKIKEIVTK